MSQNRQARTHTRTVPKLAFKLGKANSVMTVHKPSTSRPSPAKLRELLAMDAVTNAVQYLLARQL